MVRRRGKDLKPIYTTINADRAMLTLEQLEAKWDQVGSRLRT